MGARASDQGLVVDMRPEPLGEAAEFLLHLEERAGVDRNGFQFAAMADHAGIFHERVDLLGVKARDLADVEVREGLSVMLTLLQDGDPGESSLRAFEDELFEELSVVTHGYAPFVIMIGDIQRIVSAPEATRLRLGHVRPWSRDHAATRSSRRAGRGRERPARSSRGRASRAGAGRWGRRPCRPDNRAGSLRGRLQVQSS